MRMAASLCLVALLLSSTPSFAQPSAGRVFVRGSFGYAGQSLSDWNDFIESIEQAFQNAGIPASFETFGGAIPFGFELGYQANELLSVSLGVTRQSDSADNSYNETTWSFTRHDQVAITTVTGSVSYWVPNTRGLFFGADAGIGLGSAKTEGSVRYYLTPANDEEYRGDWSGNGFVAGAFGGYQYEFPGGFSLHAKLGYQFQNLGVFDGDDFSSRTGPDHGPPVDRGGLPMETDFSGVQLMVGMGVVFGAR